MKISIDFLFILHIVVLMKTKKYIAYLGGSSWAKGPVSEFDTITECRNWAESYGNTADHCNVYTQSGKQVASHRRDNNGNGMDWFKASF